MLQNGEREREMKVIVNLFEWDIERGEGRGKVYRKSDIKLS